MTISAAQAVSFTGTPTFAGALGVGSGGTGATTLTGYVKGSGTTAMTASATVPTTDLTGTLGVANGGTGATTLAANNVLLGNNGSALQAVAPSTSGNVLTSNGTTWTSATPAAYPLTSGTAVTSTSGTSIDFTSIPSWVKRITVMFNGVSTNGGSSKLIQIGAGSVLTTGYSASSATISSTTSASSYSTGFGISSGGASEILNGSMTISLLGSNQWVCQGIFSTVAAGPYIWPFSGSVALGGTLDRVRITTVNGTDAFDAGSINILYE
jgi:hypothetical protein